MINFPSNPDIGDIYTFEGLSWIWNGFAWDSYAAPQEDLSVLPNNGLDLSGNVLSTTYNTMISDDVNSVEVGGAAVQPASVWKTRNIVQVLDTILFPDIYPTYTIPTTSITNGTTGTREVGSTINQDLTITYTKNDAGPPSQIRWRRGSSTIASTNSPAQSSATAVPDQFGYNNPNNPNYNYSFSHAENYVVTLGNTSWRGQTDYATGLVKKNNKGVDDDRTFAVRSVNAPQASSNSFQTSERTVTGIYPIFWGKSSTQPDVNSILAQIASGDATKIVSAHTGTISINFNAIDEYIWVVHPASSTTKTLWYFTPLNQGSISNGSVLQPPITNNISSPAPDNFWNNISYKIYFGAYATTTDGVMELRNS